jgi:Ca2+-transporting ATPase
MSFTEIGAQVLIVFVGGAAFQVTSIGGREWGIAIALGFVSIPLGALIRCIPNGPCERLFVLCRLIPNPAAAEGLPTERPESTHWNYTIDRVRDSLGTFSNVRGGRVRASSFVDRSRNARPSESAPAPHL